MKLQRALWALSVSAALHVAVIGWGGRLFQGDTAPPVARRVETRFHLSPPPPPPPEPAARPAPPLAPPPKARPEPPPPREVVRNPEPVPAPVARVEPVVAEPEANPPARPPPPVAVVPPEVPPQPNPPPEVDPLHFPETRPDYSRLVSSVRGRIDGAKRYPRLARRAGYEGRTLLKFKVLRSGEVEDVHVLESSAFTILDEAAVAAVRRAAPFSAQGEQIEGDFIEIILPIVFKLR